MFLPINQLELDLVFCCILVIVGSGVNLGHTQSSASSFWRDSLSLITEPALLQLGCINSAAVKV
jgi:hypothetical protein